MGRLDIYKLVRLTLADGTVKEYTWYLQRSLD